VSNPFTIFDNSHIYNTSSIVYWSGLTNGTGSIDQDLTTSKETLSVGAVQGDYALYQTRQRFKYQPGKSHEILVTGVLDTETDVIKRCGLFDVDNVGDTIDETPKNGIYFENNSGTLSWNIANNGVVTETALMANWNVDMLDGSGLSGKTLNIMDSNIFFLDMEWLGVGTVRVGFVIDGEIVICHEFHHSSNGFDEVYMRTPNLPVNFSIISDGGEGSLKQICISVISEGGFNPQGLLRRAIVDDITVDTTPGLLLGLRLKANSFDASIVLQKISIIAQSSGDFEWFFAFNPTYTGTVVWSDLDNSNVQTAINNGNNVTDRGIDIDGGFVSSDIDSGDANLDTSLRLGKDLEGNFDEIWLCVRTLSGSEDFYASITFRDLL
jgi:hypothetical protein